MLKSPSQRSQRNLADMPDSLVEELDAAVMFVPAMATVISSVEVPGKVMTAHEIRLLTDSWLTAVNEIAYGDNHTEAMVRRLRYAAPADGVIVAGII